MNITQPLELTARDGTPLRRYRLVEISDEHDGVEPLCECGGNAHDHPTTAGHDSSEAAQRCPIARAKVDARRGVARGLSFGDATAAMKRGYRVHRAGWNGKGMWLRYVDLYNDTEFSLREAPLARGTWLPFIAMKTADNGLVPWNASQADALATDWFVIEEDGASQ